MKSQYPELQWNADHSYKGTMKLLETHGTDEIWECITKDFTTYLVIQHSDDWANYSSVKGDFEADDYGVYTDKGWDQALKQARRIIKSKA